MCIVFRVKNAYRSGRKREKAQAKTKRITQRIEGLLCALSDYRMECGWCINARSGYQYLALYQPCVFQALEMLRNRGFRYGQFFVDIAKIAHRLTRKELQDSHAGRMSDGLGEARQLFLIGCMSLSSISVEAGKANCSFFAFILFAKSRTTRHCVNFSIRKSAFRRQLPRIHYKNQIKLPRIHYKNQRKLPRIHYKVAIFA